MVSSRIALLFFAALGEAGASPESVLHEAPDLPCAWRKVQRFVSEEHPVTVRFALKQQNLEKLKSIALSVSDPRSEKYGKFLSREDIRALTSPDPSHMAAVESWLADVGVPFQRLGVETIEASFSLASATKHMKTRFHHAANDKTKQVILRAGDYQLPSRVHDAVAAVYGLHGLPAPRRESTLRSAAGVPAVTPAVIWSTYNVSGVKVSASTTNRQAVAEFQGQTTNATDLKAFFKEFDASAPSTDATVYKFVGDNGAGSEGVEAGLDIEYIMGVSPGIQSEFWYWGGNDFCADLKNWTDTILSDANAPLVHSVSYGFQGPLEQLGCQEATVQDVDANFVKLAASGISIIFASGDSGSGYAPSCATDAFASNTSVTGTGAQNISVMSAAQCCQAASRFPAWTFTPPAKTGAAMCSPQGGEAFEGVEVAGGAVPSADDCCAIASSGSYPGVKGYTYVPTSSNGGGKCTLFGSISGKKSEKSATSSTVSPPLRGTCTAFQAFTSKSSDPGDVSGGASVKPVAPKLYPSWPASSQWVTSVGATRFIDQKVGEPEMASDQFGSGGGFSATFSAFKDQVDAVNQYLKIATDLPPKGSYAPGGRATPDVSALGEGYQVLANGQLQAVGGTSASTPAFSAMISLINEARLGAGKKQMGYLNPFIYQNADAFTDVTVGTNAIGRGTGPTPYGFKCAKGWDPATGLGTPIFPKLLSAAMATDVETIVV